MNILYAAFDPVPWPKGSGTRIEATVRALARAGAKVHLHTPAPPRTIEGFSERLEVENIVHEPVGVHDENFIDRVLNFRTSVTEVLARKSFDAAIFRSPWEGVPIVRSVPKVVYEVHGFPSVELVSHYPAIQKETRLIDRLISEENYCLSHSQLFVTPSGTNRHFLMRRGVPPTKIRIISNSVVPPSTEAAPLPPLEPPYRVGYMGTLAPWQGIGLLFEALAFLRRELDVTLVVAGPKKRKWTKGLRDLSRRLRVHRHVEYHGALAKEPLNDLLATCHTLVAPLPNDPRNGLQGCCPIKLLEYMSCGRPIVTTAIPPVREILSHGETAVLVRPDSATALASGLRSVLTDSNLANTLAANAREAVLQNYPRQRFQTQITDLVSQLRVLPAAEREAPFAHET